MPKVLMIDDDREWCQELKEILEDCRYNVDVVHDGLEAMRQLERAPYDVLLLDLKIPGVNGLQILQRVKQEAIPGKVIVLTGRPLMQDPPSDSWATMEENVLDLADEILGKPVSVPQLLDRIQQLAPAT